MFSSHKTNSISIANKYFSTFDCDYSLSCEKIGKITHLSSPPLNLVLKEAALLWIYWAPTASTRWSLLSSLWNSAPKIFWTWGSWGLWMCQGYLCHLVIVFGPVNFIVIFSVRPRHKFPSKSGSDVKRWKLPFSTAFGRRDRKWCYTKGAWLDIG